MPLSGRRPSDHQLPRAQVDLADAGIGVRKIGAGSHRYRHVIKQRNRYFSYGDAMLLACSAQNTTITP
jgi:hypothetical protein